MTGTEPIVGLLILLQLRLVDTTRWSWAVFPGRSTNSITSGTTFYLTKDHANVASLSTDWEVLGAGQHVKGTSGTHGQSLTMEWGSTHVLALDQQSKKLLEFGVAGYDERVVSGNGVPLASSLSSSGMPFSIHAMGFQSNFILPEKNVSLSFKYSLSIGVPQKAPSLHLALCGRGKHVLCTQFTITG